MTRASRRVRAVASMAAAFMLVGCGTGTPAGGQSGSRTASHASAVSPAPSLVAKADLARCPSTDEATATSGKALPAVTLPCLGSGPDVRLNRLRGPLVVNVWATWCGPCREEVPLFQDLHESTGSRLAVLGIDFQDTSAGAALSFLVDVGAHYPSVYDGDGASQAALGASSGLPVTLFVGRSGRVVHRKVGPYPSQQALSADVRKYLGVRP